MKAATGGGLTWCLLAAAVVCNAAAQLLIKRGAPSALLPLAAWLDARLVAALVLYGLSFLLTAIIYARLPLSLASPLMAGGVFVLVGLGAASLLGEPIGPARISGAALILAGMAVLAQDMG